MHWATLAFGLVSPPWHLSTWDKIIGKSNRSCGHPCLQLNPTHLRMRSQNVGTFAWLKTALEFSLAWLNISSHAMCHTGLFRCSILPGYFLLCNLCGQLPIPGMILTPVLTWMGPYHLLGLGFSIIFSGRPFLNLHPYKIPHVHTYHFLAS